MVPRAAPVTTQEEKWWKKRDDFPTGSSWSRSFGSSASVATTGPCRGGHHSTRNAPVECCSCAGDHSGLSRDPQQERSLSAGGRAAKAPFASSCTACGIFGLAGMRGLRPRLVLGGTTWLAWVLPELWGAPRLKMLLPSVWVFLPYLLVMIFLGGGQEELGWRGYILDPLEERLGPSLGSLVLGVIWAVLAHAIIIHTGKRPELCAIRRVRDPFSRLFLLLRRDAPGQQRTMAGLVTHGWANTVVPLFPPIVMAKGAAQQRYWISADLTLLVGVLAMIVRLRKTRSRLGSLDLVDGQRA